MCVALCDVVSGDVELRRVVRRPHASSPPGNVGATPTDGHNRHHNTYILSISFILLQFTMFYIIKTIVTFNFIYMNRFAFFVCADLMVLLLTLSKAVTE